MFNSSRVDSISAELDAYQNRTDEALELAQEAHKLLDDVAALAGEHENRLDSIEAVQSDLLLIVNRLIKVVDAMNQ